MLFGVGHDRRHLTRPGRLSSSPGAHQPLREVVARFAEGHETADLRVAQTQLSMIHPPTYD